ncbi:hypothetical protein R1flu_009868 [Riccia fluitans]|uniref:Bromo domain-containing protein n=1 Tax=Riccia fluitans TaxID=41844 RepID=A0ABD1Z3C8_9MARC
MIGNMAGCKGAVPADASGAASMVQLVQQPQQQQFSMDSSRSLALLCNNAAPKESVEVDLREVYFLVMHFLANGPCTRAFGQLWNELLQHKLLPRRYHAWYSREHHASGDENDDGLSFPLSYQDVAHRNPDIPNSHLVDLLQQLLVNDRRAAIAADAHSKVFTAADAPTLLGSGSFSLLDDERNKHRKDAPLWTKRMRWPHWHADQVHGLMLREIGGGFARHHRTSSVRTASYVIAKPSVFFNRIQIIKKLRGHRNAVYCAIFNRTGQHVITGSDDRLVKIWSTETGLCLRSCRGHEGDITDLAVNSSNDLVASSSNDCSIRVWRLPDGVPISVLRGHGGVVTAIEFSPRQNCDHHLLSSSDDGTCRIWDARDSAINSRVYMPDPKDSQSAARGATVQVPAATQPSHQILCCAFNADGSIFVTGSSDKLARVWNATKWNDEHTGRPNYELDILQGHENDVNYVQFSGCAAPTRPYGVEKEEYHTRFKNTWSAHDSIVTCSRDGSAIIWTPRPRRHHAKAGRWIKAYHLRVPPPPNPPPPPRPGGSRQRLLPTPRGVNMVVWSLDNRFVLAAIMDCRICVWNAVDGSLVHSLTGHDKQTYVLDVHPFNPRIAMSAGYDGRVIIWDIWDGHPIRVYETGDYNLVDGNFSPDGSSLVVSDEVGQIYLFATAEGNSQKDAKYDQFFLGDFRPLVRDTHGNVLDQETQLPPHQRNLQDLLCDASMIPYAEPYQTNYQQRRLGALGIDWQPPAVFLAIGTFDDPAYIAAPEPTIAVHAPVVPSPERRERRNVTSEGASRWVEQPNENEEAMDWEQDAVGVTEDSGSDYSASEESDEDGDRADSKADSEEEAEEEEEDPDEDEDEEGSEDIGSRLRRSSRNKRKAELVKHSSSGRRLKRKRYDDGGDQRSIRRSLRRRKAKSARNGGFPRRHQPESSNRRHQAESSRQHQRESSSRHHAAEPSRRPKRLAARNALHLFSSINEDEDEEALAVSEKKLREQGERASGSGEPQRILRSSNREELEELSKVAISQAPRVESSDIGEFSRRPRSKIARKLVVKLRDPAPRVELEDSRCEPSDEGEADTVAVDQGGASDVALQEDHVGTSENVPVRKLVIKFPRPSVGMKRNLAVIESSEDNHYDSGNGNDVQVRTRKLEQPSSGSDEDECNGNDGAPSVDKSSWQWKKGKAAKRARGGESAAGDRASASTDSSDSNGSAEQSNGTKQVQDEWDGIYQRKPLGRSNDSIPEEAKDSDGGKWQINGRFEGPAEPEVGTSSGSGADALSGERHFQCDESQRGKHLRNLQPCRNRIETEDGQENVGSDREYRFSPKMKQNGITRDENGKAKDRSGAETSYKAIDWEETDALLRMAEESGHRLKHLEEQPESSRKSQIQDVDKQSDLPQNSLGRGPEQAEAWDRHRPSEDDGSSGPNVSARPMSSHCSGDDGKNFRIPEDHQFEGHGQRNSDNETDMVEGEVNGDFRNGAGDEMGESMRHSESGGEESEQENSLNDHFEANGVCGKNWGESDNRETDEESADEGKSMTRRKKQKVLGELQSNGREESTSRRQNLSIEVSGKPRVRHMQSVLQVGGRETRSRAGKQRATSPEPVERIRTRTRTQGAKDPQNSWQNGTVERGLRTRGRHQELPATSQLPDTRRGRTVRGSSSEPEGSVEFERRRGARKVEKLEGDEIQELTRERRTSGRTRREDVKRELPSERERGRRTGESSDVYARDVRGKRNRVKPDREKEKLAWLLLTEVEAGTRYIPQFNDDVVYLRQGHQEYLESVKSEEKGPWKTLKLPIRAVEFCRIIGLEYVILPETDETYCRLTLKFTDSESKVIGKQFKLMFKELTDFSDFIVERSRYDWAVKKGWVVRDKCQVWWRSEGEVGGGVWWDGRIIKLKAKSAEFPDSPWDRFTVQYKESSDPETHSPWELFEPGNHWHDPPRIDIDSKTTLLASIQELEKSRFVGTEDEYGLRRLSQDVEDPKYVNRTPLPLDLETVKQRLEKDYYHSLEAFNHDIELLVKNVQGYYGEETEQAAKIRRLAQFLFDEHEGEADASDGNDDDF